MGVGRAGHERTWEMKNVYKVLVVKPEWKLPLGRAEVGG
jgi:hypothetical protein